ncbi:RCC1 domain-containing protein [Planomonospora sp. ID82291]|uniref:RCC1-like domain-containing protein n=1 Tax=Planomonospora sp. ID82291 TaxID=2738136 RepID=UPI0018C433F6|nr:RCC1 domain-containing protein [Planomonospora sp. ID82291]MBG0813894.1 chromosome condensation regulator RCC1 [Planomonospora sp. ID82291]
MTSRHILLGGAAALLLLLSASCAASETARPAASEDSGTPSSAVTGGVWATGWNADGQLGHPTEEISTALGQVRGLDGGPALDRITAVAAGGRHSLALLDDGSVVAWGANDFGQLGDGTTTGRSAPVAVRAPDGRDGELRKVVALSANSDFSMALLADGKVVTWGKGDAGQRGIGSETAPLTPTTVLAPDGSGPLTGVTAIAADGRTELVLLEDGSLLSWGANKYGMVGDGTTENRSLPVPVRGLDGAERLTGATAVAMGGQHGLALLQDGSVAAWGYNDMGQLGTGDHRTRMTPVLVSGPGGRAPLRGVIAISSAEKHNFAILRDHTVVSWGNNTAGQLGDNTVERRTTPVQVVGANGEVLRAVRSVFAGEAYGVALLDDDTIRTWGANGKGQLGSGDRNPRSRSGPIVLAGGEQPGRAVTAAAGERHLLLVLQQAY